MERTPSDQLAEIRAMGQDEFLTRKYRLVVRVRELMLRAEAKIIENARRYEATNPSAVDTAERSLKRLLAFVPDRTSYTNSFVKTDTPDMWYVVVGENGNMSTATSYDPSYGGWVIELEDWCWDAIRSEVTGEDLRIKELCEYEHKLAVAIDRSAWLAKQGIDPASPTIFP